MVAPATSRLWRGRRPDRGSTAMGSARSRSRATGAYPKVDPTSRVVRSFRIACMNCKPRSGAAAALLVRVLAPQRILDQVKGSPCSEHVDDPPYQALTLTSIASARTIRLIRIVSLWPICATVTSKVPNDIVLPRIGGTFDPGDARFPACGGMTGPGRTLWLSEEQTWRYGIASPLKLVVPYDLVVLKCVIRRRLRYRRVVPQLP